VCGIGSYEGEWTSDAELPPAVGGIAAFQDEPDGPEELDRCDGELSPDELTAASELPVATGGT
jgi:hypothetical protein